MAKRPLSSHPGTHLPTRHCECSEAIYGHTVAPIAGVVVETKGGPWIATSPSAPRNDEGGVDGPAPALSVAPLLTCPLVIATAVKQSTD